MLHVEPGQPTAAFGSIYKGLPDPGIAVVARDLAKIVPTKAGLNYEHRIRAGDPIEQILAEARERDVVAIVLGSRGRSGVQRLLLGSVAEGVLRNAPCPVMICKMPPTVEPS
jgi:nucleotide-binding universal stress UspA family protein